MMTEQHHHVTPDQITHQLLLDGKPPTKQHKTKIQCQYEVESNSFTHWFSQQELEATIQHLTSRKATGLDDICTDQIVCFRPVIHFWLLQLLNICKKTGNIPRVWRQSRVVVILKRSKDLSNLESFRQISLLSHLHKLNKWLLLNSLFPIIDPQVMSEYSWLPPWKIMHWSILEHYPTY